MLRIGDLIRLQQAVGYRYKNDGLSISKADYAGGNFIMAYALSPTQCDGSYKDPIKSGKLAIDLKFNVAIPYTINVIVLAEFEKLLNHFLLGFFNFYSIF